MSLDVMRKTPHTRLKKSAFELHYGRNSNTEISNLLNLDEIEKLTKRSVSAKPDTLQVYSFSGAGRVSDQLPMKPKKGAKGVSNYPFSFLEKKHHRNNVESAYSDKLQLAISGTSHTVTTPNGRVLHRKLIGKPIETFKQENNNRGTGPRGSDGGFIRSPSKQRRTMVIGSEDDSEAPLMEWANQKTPESPNTTVTKKGSLGRGRPKLIRDRNSSNSPQTSPDNNHTQGSSTGPLTITTTNMKDTDVDRTIEDANIADQEVFIRDDNGKVFTDNKTQPRPFEEILEDSELDLASNLSSSTEIEIEENDPIRRSKRSTKTNPIVRYNNPICQDYRSYCRKAELGPHTESNRGRTGGGRKHPNQSQDKIQTLRTANHRNIYNSRERSTAHQTLDQWRTNRHNEKQNAPIGRSSANSRRGNVEDRGTTTNCKH